MVDEEYLRHPFLGSRRMALWLKEQGRQVNRKRVQRLMRLMGIEAIYPKRKTTVVDASHRVYPYLLRDVPITHPNHVWSTDITYIPLRGGFMYLVAVMDWYSRYVLSWCLSNSLDTSFCLEALDVALADARPEIFNTDQGCQFTSSVFTSRLLENEISISMDGRGRAIDNVFIERLWRSVKYEDIYLKSYERVDELYQGLTQYFAWYNGKRPHQSLDNRTPESIYRGERTHASERLLEARKV